MPSSRAALRLSELARDRGDHEAIHDRLMDAYWAEGRNIGDLPVLRELAAEVGLDETEVEEVLEGDAYLERVLASTQQAMQIGVNGVPGFLLDERLLVLGAQPKEVLEQAYAKIGAR